MVNKFRETDFRILNKNIQKQNFNTEYSITKLFINNLVNLLFN